MSPDIAGGCRRVLFAVAMLVHDPTWVVSRTALGHGRTGDADAVLKEGDLVELRIKLVWMLA